MTICVADYTSQRQLPTDHDYATSTREYQTDQSSLKPAPTAAGSALDKRPKQRQQQKQPHRFAGIDRVAPYQGLCSSYVTNFIGGGRQYGTADLWVLPHSSRWNIKADPSHELGTRLVCGCACAGTSGIHLGAPSLFRVFMSICVAPRSVRSRFHVDAW